MHHGTCVTHVPWCMSGSLTCGDGENVPGIPGACAPAILRIWQEAHYISLRRMAWVILFWTTAPKHIRLREYLIGHSHLCNISCMIFLVIYQGRYWFPIYMRTLDFPRVSWYLTGPFPPVWKSFHNIWYFWRSMSIFVASIAHNTRC